MKSREIRVHYQHLLLSACVQRRRGREEGKEWEKEREREIITFFNLNYILKFLSLNSVTLEIRTSI